MRHAVTRREAFGTGFYFSMGIMSGLFLATLLAAGGVLVAWRYLGFVAWPG
jgi:hypothetical protein